MRTIDNTVTSLKGVGEELAKKLAILKIRTIADLIHSYPRRYEDYSVITPIAQLRPGAVTIRAVIKQSSGRYARRGLHVTEAVASDETGSVRLVWFNQPYRAQSIKPGVSYYVSGEFAHKSGRLAITSPSMEAVSEFTVNTARIIPVYRETKGLKSTQLRKMIQAAVPYITDIAETLPPWIIKDQKLMSRAEALMNMHFPTSVSLLDAAKRRLGFEEVFELSLAGLMNKHELMQDTAVAVPFDEQMAKTFVASLPFTLTDGQRTVIWQIYLDMQRTMPMNRLIEGDVGSGKTVVAVMAALMAIRHGYQAAYMAPTEILARQHAETIHALLTPLGMQDQVGLLIGGLTPKQKQRIRERAATHDVSLLIGTHALITDKVDMKALGLVIIDEQHRFGVDQRKALMAKAGHAPHVLSMTATPIPRSLALTLYGEQDISLIKTMPAGRKPIITKLVSPNSRKQLNDKILTQLNEGRQVFVVCPLVNESDTVPARSVEAVYEDIKKIFTSHRVGVLHGKLKPAEKDSIMQSYVSHDIDILVATTVIEVGVNVPNATVMVVENAERFGLAQIHQLRGRVGRSDHQGYCYLVLGDSSEPSRRLRALESSSDGFKLAELDLEIRGPGAIYGTMQHGELDLRVARLTDVELIAAARKSAQKFIDTGENLLEYKELAERVQRLRRVTNLN